MHCHEDEITRWEIKILEAGQLLLVTVYGVGPLGFASSRGLGYSSVSAKSKNPEKVLSSSLLE